MNETIGFGDGFIPCAECGLPARFIGFDEEQKVEDYRCDHGHVTEVPEVK